MSKFNELVTKLREIFQIDRPELDFGIYRILNARAAEINDYLENRLKEKVLAALSSGNAVQQEQVARELKEKEAQYQADGIDPASVPKIKELHQKLAQYSTGANEHENAVFSHLLAFFSRYYDSGDFISQRRYKGDTYAIPYAGEEVMLHWANKDQYYTKSGENFANYSFKLDDGRKVAFRLVAADTAKDNRKDNDKERRFALIEPMTLTRSDDQGDEYKEELRPIEEVAGPDGHELVLCFEYKPMPKGTKQDALTTKAVQVILGDATVKTKWLDLNKRAPTEKDPQRTVLEKHLAHYTTKNSADYFIHKDLGGFLRQELDFYIKNEVMHLDDIQNAEQFADIEKSLRMIQCLRSIANDLITFLAQLEDFQKKLWLKKKFVVSSHYCITLDRVPVSLYPSIAANSRQWAQWEELGMLEVDNTGLFKPTKENAIAHIEAHPNLMVDTALFDAEFKSLLLASIGDVDGCLDGLLIHGDNFQALNLLQDRYREQAKCIYIDPPYNTGGDGFSYKDNYRHSSWLSMMIDRISLGKSILLYSGVFFASIDKTESPILRQILDGIFLPENIKAQVIWQKRYTRSNNTIDFTTTVEHLHCYAKSEHFSVPLLPRTDEADARYSNPDSDTRGAWKGASFLNPATPAQRPNLCYPIVNPNTGAEVFPTTNAWRRSLDEFKKLQSDNRLYWGGDGKSSVPSIKMFLSEARGLTPIDFWSHDYAGNTDAGTAEIGDLFNYKIFQNPKPSTLVKRVIEHSSSDANSLILDYFAGSGTTGHAVIKLNREDGGQRKYMLVEQGEYFDLVTKPRIQKVVYSADWKDGKPNPSTENRTLKTENPYNGISHCFKVIKLESYEDTLNNLNLRRTEQQGDLLNSLSADARENYLLSYMLDVESRGSLLSVDTFKKPFDFTLKVAVDSAGASEVRKVDLVETFNYLIGLRVKHIDAQPERGFITVTGTLPSNETCLVLWRDCDVLEYEGISKLCDKLAINPADNEFDVVYLNGDHNIPTVLTATQEEGGATRVLKLRQIEPEFLERMFSVEGV